MQFRKYFLSRAVLQVIMLSLFISGCILEPLDLIGLPCVSDEDCAHREVCRRETCQLDQEDNCSKDTQCKKNEHCVNKVCKETAQCQKKDCAKGFTCDLQKKICVKNKEPDCTNNNDCNGKLCVQGKCVPCKKDADCQSNGFTCDLQKKICVKNKEPNCTNNSDCNGKLCVRGKCVPCKKDADCQSSSFACSKGLCVATKKCRTKIDCETNLCNSGICTECQSNADCGEDACKSGICIKKCRSYQDCQSNLCRSGLCANCKNSNDCDGRRCNNGVCEAPTACTTPYSCKSHFCSSVGICKKCSQKADCNGLNCVNGTCDKPCKENNDCSNKNCKNGKCVPRKTCQVPEDCPNSLRCVDNLCANPCKDTSVCSSGRFCEAGRCRIPKSGEKCIPIVGCQQDSICILLQNRSVCRPSCNPLKTKPCPSNQGCQLLPNQANLEKAGVCVPRIKGRKEGEICDITSNLCEVDLICRNNGTKSFCRKLCNMKDSTCKSKKKCFQFKQQRKGIGLCLPPTCENVPSACKSEEVCIDQSCRKKCDPKKTKTGCSSSQICFSKGSKHFCLEKECGYLQKTCSRTSACNKFRCNPIKPAPKKCYKASDCDSRSLCLGYDSSGYCHKKCTPSSPASCPSDHLCSVQGKKKALSICLPRNGGLGTGKSCDGTTKICEVTHYCLTLSTGAICIRTCDPLHSKSGCPSRSICKAIGTTKLGACISIRSRYIGQTCGILYGKCTTGKALCILREGKAALCRKVCKKSYNCPSKYKCNGIKGSTLRVCVPSS